MSGSDTRSKRNAARERELFGRLAASLAPIAPPASRAAELRARVLAAASGAHAARTPDFVTVRSAEGAWREIEPGIARKDLHRDAVGEAFLLRLAPGAVLRRHGHAAHEECLVLEGETVAGDLRLRAGDFHLARAGTEHVPVHSQHGALLYIRTIAAAGAP